VHPLKIDDWYSEPHEAWDGMFFEDGLQVRMIFTLLPLPIVPRFLHSLPKYAIHAINLHARSSS
jgi:hypothetical protein